MRNRRDAIARDIRETQPLSIAGVARHCITPVKCSLVLSSGIGVLFYVIHSVRIHYVPNTQFADLAGVFVLLFLVGAGLLGYFALLVGVPAALWASSLPTERPVPGKKSARPRKPGCADYFLVVAFLGVWGCSHC